MDLRVTSVAVILMMVLAYGNALQCYYKVFGDINSRVVECNDSCTASTNYHGDEPGGALQCYYKDFNLTTPRVTECTNLCSASTSYYDNQTVIFQYCGTIGYNSCVTTVVCSCDTPLCNTGTEAANRQSGAPNPQGGVSACIALKVTWLVVAMMVIGARILH